MITPPESSAKQNVGTQESIRDIDPNVRQRMAADPSSCVWVNASAGSGKTKVLTDRVLRLLLPRKNGEPGTKADKILCLTFTKAGASEMSLRVQKILGAWAVIEKEQLHASLENLLGHAPTYQHITTARRLFADIIDIPGGLKIMTIHSFCQSLLGRFPLEAGLSPGFKIMEESDASALLNRAVKHTLSEQQNADGTPIQRALTAIAETINEEQFSSIVGNIISQRFQFEKLQDNFFGIDGLYTNLCADLNIQPGVLAEEILLQACQNTAFNYSALKDAAETMAEHGTKTDQKHSDLITSWLAGTAQERTSNFNNYVSVYFTATGGRRAKLAGVKVPSSAIETLEQEAGRLEDVQNQIRASQSAALTKNLLLLGRNISNHYQSLKAQQGALDFDDLIFKTENLLSQKNGASWVLFKLDQGLDHILIDEAQDTNPEQWRIIEALCGEFFAGDGQSETTRTFFTVGDEKQSIYSFHRASPEEFHRVHDDLKTRIKQTGQRWNDVDLNISFRSTPSVLKAVDAVFASPDRRKGLSSAEIQHISFRRRQAGLVELWPLFETQDTDQHDPWTPPTQIIEHSSSASQLAEHLADKISTWIEDKVILPSYDRPIHAGDIMILVRTRTRFVNQLVKALKNKNIPVSGVDRMILGEQLIVEDLMALIAFTLLPSDDLNLACILKSPLIGFSEDDLYDVAQGRSSSLWETLKQSVHTQAYEYLSALIDKTRTLGPYDILKNIIQTPCPADSVSGLRAIKTRLGEDALDPLNELLNAAIQFESDNTPSLQSFLRWHQQEQSTIKRELGEHASQLRIMTIHGSKGLQAPIVILPDTIRTTKNPPGKSDARLLWPDKSGLKTPIWSPRKEFDTPLYKEGQEKANQGLEEEYKRLLYVAMTRAEERLYIAGHAGSKKPLDESWYNYVKQGLEALDDIEHYDDGTLALTNPQTQTADNKETGNESTKQYEEIPSWAYANAMQQAEPRNIINPSRVEQEENPAPSPLKSKDNYRFRRGNLTHKLLEILPNIDPEKQTETAHNFIEKFGKDLPPSTRKSIVLETLKILNHSEFSPLFGAGSQAEVSITGALTDATTVSGQIDRLLITDTKIWIIDYKTNRPPPQNFEDVPVIYQKQMQAYADILKNIYPNREIHCALLWTDGPFLMPMPIK